MAKSAFYDIADSRDEATNLTARSILMMAIEQRIHENRWTQTRATRELGVQQPRVSDLMNGKIDKFSLDALVNMLPAVGLTFSVGPAAAIKRVRAVTVPSLAESSPRRTPARTAKAVARRKGPKVAAAASKKSAAAAKARKK